MCDRNAVGEEEKILKSGNYEDFILGRDWTRFILKQECYNENDSFGIRLSSQRGIRYCESDVKGILCRLLSIVLCICQVRCGIL